MRENTFVDGRGNGDGDDLEKQERERVFRIAAEAIIQGLQEAAFICEGYAARLSEGYDHHTEYDAVCECFRLIDQRIQEHRQAFTASSETLPPIKEGGNR